MHEGLFNRDLHIQDLTIDPPKPEKSSPHENRWITEADIDAIESDFKELPASAATLSLAAALKRFAPDRLSNRAEAMKALFDLACAEIRAQSALAVTRGGVSNAHTLRNFIDYEELFPGILDQFIESRLYLREVSLHLQEYLSTLDHNIDVKIEEACWLAVLGVLDQEATATYISPESIEESHIRTGLDDYIDLIAYARLLVAVKTLYPNLITSDTLSTKFWKEAEDALNQFREQKNLIWLSELIYFLNLLDHQRLEIVNKTLRPVDDLPVTDTTQPLPEQRRY